MGKEDLGERVPLSSDDCDPGVKCIRGSWSHGPLRSSVLVSPPSVRTHVIRASFGGTSLKRSGLELR